MSRDSFIFYRSFFEASKPLNNDQKAQLFDAICIYALDYEETELEPITKAMFSLIKPQLEANYKRYLNGKKGASIKQAESKAKAKVKQSESKAKANVNVNVNVNDNVNDTTKVVRRFTPPTLEEVKILFADKGSTNLEAEKFYNFYGAKGWMIGRNKMKSVKLAVAGWITRNKDNERGKDTKQARATAIEQGANAAPRVIT